MYTFVSSNTAMRSWPSQDRSLLQLPPTTLVHVAKLIILPIRQVQKGLPTQTRIIILTNRRVLVLHTMILDHSLLPIRDSLPALERIQHHQIRQLDPHHADERAENPQHAPQPGMVRRRVLLVEEQRPDDVPRARARVVQAHHHALLRRARRVAHDPRHDQRIPAEEEGKEVVPRQQRALHGVRAREYVQHRGARDDGQADRGEDGALDARFLGGVGGEEDDDELQCAEGDVEQACRVGVVAEAVEDEGPEGVGHGGADVEEERHPDPEVGLGFEGELPDV